MIVTALFTFFMGFFEDFTPLSIPQIEEFVGYFEHGLQLIVDGVSLLGLFIGDIGLYAIAIYLGSIVSINIFYLSWQFIWFCIKKIPMVNIRE